MCSASAEGATIQAATCERDAVAAAANSASDGDTIVIPAGRCTWSTNLTITNKILTLQGAGLDQTTIVDGVSKANYPNISQALVVITKDGGLTRITGITFQGGTIVDPYNKGIIQIEGSSHRFRLDNCKFIPTQTRAMTVYGNVWGVIDHNTFDLSNEVPTVGLYIYHGTWNNTGSYGDASWADDDSVGTERAMFVEDNLFMNDQSSRLYRWGNDGWGGGRVVYRYNTYVNTLWANHGTESSGRSRSQRQFEVYHNTFSLNGVSLASFVGSRGGVGVVFNNTGTVTAGVVSRFFDLQYYRLNTSYAPWGLCNGSSVWDGNQSGGYPCLDQPGRGKGNLLSGDNPTPQGWPNQIPAPTYAWNNTLNGLQSNLVSNVPTLVIETRDFYNSPRPGYAPYVYPHPLVSSTTATPPPAPGNLQVQ